MTQRLSLAVILAAFWLALSGHYTPLLLGLGAISIVLVVLLADRLGIIDHEGRPLQLLLRAPRLWVWLGGQIAQSAWRVTRIVWSPRMRLNVAYRSVPVTEMSDLERVTYANAITLTPGTLSVTVGEHAIEVHGLEAQSIEQLGDGEMARRVRRLEDR